MPFEKTVTDNILLYYHRDLPEDSWYDRAFDFIKDTALKKTNIRI